VDEIMDRFNPSVKHHIYEVHFVPVVRRTGSDSPTSRVQVEDRFVVEIRIVSCPGLVYMTPNGKCFFRHKSRNEEYTTQEVREKTIEEQENLYSSEMNSLRKELEEMKRQLGQKSEVTHKTSPSVNLQDNVSTLTLEEKSPVNGEYGSRIAGTAVASSDSLIESQVHDMQEANCVIS